VVGGGTSVVVVVEATVVGGAAVVGPGCVSTGPADGSVPVEQAASARDPTMTSTARPPLPRRTGDIAVSFSDNERAGTSGRSDRRERGRSAQRRIGP